ncbi:MULTISPECIES: hypothetical protein [unclassified Clostridium]|uniref:hypothetical protein n=1 Tax=unclassified Clostridium TaxID=2614128 RepID=UPI0025B7FB53|nr:MULTISPECIES: hypothetical protein [unclassified Clostridium]
MFIYKLSMKCENTDRNGETAYSFKYLMHKNKFSREEFESMCKEAFSVFDAQAIYSVKLYLKMKYNFIELPIEADFDFEERF